MGTATFPPSWWDEKMHGSAWERSKEALKRDFEQTKNDFTPGAPDLNQDVSDTIAQAAGKQPVPAPGQKTPPSKSELSSNVDKRGIGTSKNTRFEDVEGPLSYGYAARMQYESKYPKWDEKLENTLRSEWSSGNNPQKFDDVVPYIRRGFNAPHPK